MFTKFWTFLHWRFLHWYQTPVLFLNTTSSQRFLDLNSFLATAGSVSAVVLVDIYLLWKKNIFKSFKILPQAYVLRSGQKMYTWYPNKQALRIWE